ncbi:unnamed protein product [Cunninghamella blakesleeana]
MDEQHKEQHIDIQKRNEHENDINHHQASLSKSVEEENASPLREQRQRRNLRLPGNVDVDNVSSGLSSSDNRRHSWIDKINQAAKKAIKRTSFIATETDHSLIDKIADSMNKHDENDEHPSENESWTDKFMNVLFPSLQLSPPSRVEPESTMDKKEVKENDNDNNKIPETTPSDDHYDDVQKSMNEESNESWEKNAATIAQEVDKNALNQRLDIKKEVMIDGGSDDHYDDAQAEFPNETILKDLNTDIHRTIVSDKHRFDNNHFTSNQTDHQMQRLKDQKEELENQPPPEFRDHPPYDVIDNKKERRRLRKQKLVEEQDILGKQSHFDNDFENWSARPRQLS